jgi:hypothetical protein
MRRAAQIVYLLKLKEYLVFLLDDGNGFFYSEIEVGGSFLSSFFLVIFELIHIPHFGESDNILIN